MDREQLVDDFWAYGFEDLLEMHDSAQVPAEFQDDWIAAQRLLKALTGEVEDTTTSVFDDTEEESDGD